MKLSLMLASLLFTAQVMGATLECQDTYQYAIATDQTKGAQIYNDLGRFTVVAIEKTATGEAAYLEIKAMYGYTAKASVESIDGSNKITITLSQEDEVVRQLVHDTDSELSGWTGLVVDEDLEGIRENTESLINLHSITINCRIQ